MVKSYLRYSPSSTLGVIVSPNSNILCSSQPSSKSTTRTLPTLAIVPALESIKIWNVKTSTLLTTLHDPPSTAEVTVLSQSTARKNLIAAGYQDGSIRIWKLNDTCTAGELQVTFNGHKSAVTELCFDATGNRLASGSRDTDVVLWDIVSEDGIARLRSHQDQITGLAFIMTSSEGEGGKTGDLLLSAGKDGLIKVWDLSTNFCVETHLAHRGETWGLAVSSAQDVVVTAGPDGELKFWFVGLQVPDNLDGEKKILTQRGSISRTNRDRPLSLKFHSTSGFLGVHSANRNIEVFRTRSAEEIKRLLSRKRKRKSSKKNANGEDEEPIEAQTIDNEIVPYTTIRASAKVRSIDWDCQSTTAPQVSSNVVLLIPASGITRYKCHSPLLYPPSPFQDKIDRGYRSNINLIHSPPRPSFRNPHPCNLLRRRNAPLSRSRKCQSLEYQNRKCHPQLGLWIRSLQHFSPR